MQLHGAGIQLLLKQVGLIMAQVLWTEPVGQLMEMPGKFLDDPNDLSPFNENPVWPPKRIRVQAIQKSVP